MYQLNSSTEVEDVGSKYEHVMTLQSLTNYDLLDSPNYVVFPYTSIDLTGMTITNSGAAWTTDCYKDMPLFVVADSIIGCRCYGSIASNTDTVITLTDMTYDSGIPATGLFIVYKGYNVDFMKDISEPTAIENYDVNVDCFEFSDNDDKRKLSTRIVATGKDVFGKTISVMVDAPHAFDPVRQFFNDSTVVRKRSEGYIYKNNYVPSTGRAAATATSAASSLCTSVGADTFVIATDYSLFVKYSGVTFILPNPGDTLPTTSPQVVEGTMYYIMECTGVAIKITEDITVASPVAITISANGSGYYINTPGGLIINNANVISSGDTFMITGTSAPTGLVLGTVYTNNSPTYVASTYWVGMGLSVGAGGVGLTLINTSRAVNSDMGNVPVAWLYGWQYTIPEGSTICFSNPNSGVAPILATTTHVPEEFTESSSLMLSQVRLSAYPESDYSGKGYLLNQRLFVDDAVEIGTNEVLVSEEKITVDSIGIDAVYGHYIDFGANFNTRVTGVITGESPQVIRKAYPHDVGALVARTNYTAAAPETGSPIDLYGLIIDNRTVDGDVTYGALDTYASNLVLGYGQFYQIATSWSPMIYGIVPHVGKISDGTPEANRYRLIQAADRISFTKFSGESAVEYETVAITIICDEGRILLNLGDFEKNPYTTMIAGTNAINRPLS